MLSWLSDKMSDITEILLIFERHLQLQLLFYVQEFLGNTDQDTVVKHRFIEGIRARYIQFHPTGWHNHISMRVEVYGCKGNIVGLQEFVENSVYMHQEEKKNQKKQDLPIFRPSIFNFILLLSLSIFIVLKNTHKNPKFGRVRQVPIRELGWEFPGWDLSHFAKFGIFMGII